MRTWVLLRGLARESRHWGDFPQLLAAALGPRDRVLALDLPGNGLLCHRSSPASVQAMVSLYREQLPAPGGQGSLVLLGLSMGAMVAAEWAQRYPGELQACILVNGSARPLSPPWQRLRPSAWPALLAAAAPGRDRLSRETALLRLCSQAAPAGTAERWAELARQNPTRLVNAARQLLAAARYRLPAVPPVPPVLVLSGGADRLVDPRCSGAIARAWGCAHEVHPDAGHELALDAPSWLVQQCTRFVAARCGP